MKNAKSVLEVLFPAVRAGLLRLFFESSAGEYYVRELTLKSHLALHTVQDELRKLSALGLVTSRSNGFHRFYQANRKHPLYRHIRGIVELSENSPGTRHAALLRPARRSVSKKTRRPKPSHLPPDRPINWGTLQRRSS
jgi:predicted transcriptional regulator